MDPDAFNRFIENMRGVPGADLIIGLAAIAAGFTLTRTEDGDLLAVRS